MHEAKLYENESEKKITEKYSNNNNNNEYINEKILNNDDTFPYSRSLFESKNDKLLNQTDNFINEQTNNKSQVSNNLISNKENGYDQIRLKAEKINSAHYGNIGKNIVICNKYVFGIKSTFLLFLSTFVGMVLTFIGWILSNNYFYPLYIYIIGGIPFILTQIYFILCFLTEPGIIPRNDPNFSEVTQEIDNNLIKNESNINIKNTNNDNKKIIIILVIILMKIMK